MLYSITLSSNLLNSKLDTQIFTEQENAFIFRDEVINDVLDCVDKDKHQVNKDDTGLTTIIEKATNNEIALIAYQEHNMN